MKSADLIHSNPPEATVKFSPGEVVVISRTGDRGVVVGVDDRFRGTDELLRDASGGRAPKNRPWYHLIVEGSDTAIYVAERHLRLDVSGLPIHNPLVDSLFTNFENGRYILLNH